MSLSIAARVLGQSSGPPARSPACRCWTPRSSPVPCPACSSLASLTCSQVFVQGRHEPLREGALGPCAVLLAPAGPAPCDFVTLVPRTSLLTISPVPVLELASFVLFPEHTRLILSFRRFLQMFFLLFPSGLLISP